MDEPVENTTQNKGMFSSILNLPNDSTKKTIAVAIALCLVCSVVVSAAAVFLKPLQIENKKTDKKRNILEVTGVGYESEGIDRAFEKFEIKLVNLETGEYSDRMDPLTFDQRKAAGDPQLGIKLNGDDDIAGIGKRSKFATVYVLKEDDEIKQYVLPVHGYGLWSTLYGFLALESDANTVRGLKFYEHAETPGLGGEVDNPKWRSLWEGKKISDQSGDVLIKVVRGHVVPGLSGSEYQIDGISGATLTSQGVTNLLQYWLGDGGFGPYLNKIRTEG
jgi:Na+-transporting NADH:ubiquinone oxidoreductase subunit C